MTESYTPFQLTELDNTTGSRDLAARFSLDVLARAIPDPNQRDTLANFLETLSLASDGWYGPNAVHMLVLHVGKEVIGGGVGDYFAASNTGAIEFIAVAEAWRGQGFGTLLLHLLEARLSAHAPGSSPFWWMAEIAPPDGHRALGETAERRDRAALWHQWGYRIVDFPYLQPALSSLQAPVADLRLIARSSGTGEVMALETGRLLQFVWDYMRWGIRIARPEQTPEFAAMEAFLAGSRSVPLRLLTEESVDV